MMTDCKTYDPRVYQRAWYQAHKAHKNAQTKANRVKYKEYFKEWSRKRRLATRELIRSFKRKPCMDCGVQYPPWVMDFDHRDPTTKTFNVATSNTLNKARLQEEIAKCDLVCSNCHRVRTYNRVHQVAA